MSEWRKIWAQRALTANHYIMEALIRSNGFDSGPGKIDEISWDAYLTKFSKQFLLEKTATIFEVGCGCGAFLYPFYLKGHSVAGGDYSETMIDLAKKIMPDMNFTVMDAKEMDVKSQYDVVVSNSVFHYFDNLEYAEKVIYKMIEKAKKKVAILDINDLSMKESAKTIRRGQLNKEEYDKKYTGLNHLFFERSWFEKIAKDNGCEIQIYDQNIDGCSYNDFRFNVFLLKKNLSS